MSLCIVDNAKVYGFDESIKASKYPMSVSPETCTPVITPRVEKLAACQTGTGHDNFLNGIVVQFDLTFSLKAWVEAQRYHFLDFVSSQSTMHRITGFDIAQQCNEYVSPEVIRIIEALVEQHMQLPTKENYLKILYNIPAGFRLTARMTTNYRQLKTIYQQRKDHRLPEWREFCRWIELLPYSGLITGKEGEADG